MKNPKYDNPLREFGTAYNLWRDGKYIGRAIWTDDPNVGPSFLGLTGWEDGRPAFDVYIADRWEEVIES